MRYKIIAAFVLTLTLITFTSCANNEVDILPLIPKIKIINIAIPNYPSYEVVEGVEIFSEKIHLLSDGSLVVNVLKSEDPGAELKNGTAQLALCNTSTMEEHLSDFSIFSSAFMFNDITHALMTANSEDFHDTFDIYTENGLNATVLEAIYKDSIVLVSNQGYIGTPASLEGTTAYISHEDELAYIINKLCKNVEVGSYQAILSLLNTEVPIVGEIPQALCGGLIPATGSRTIHVIKNPIFIDFYWLSAEKDFYKNADKKTQNIILEAKSFMSAHITAENLEKDLNIESKMVENEINIIDRDFSSFRSTALEIIKDWDGFKEAWSTEKYNAIIQILK